MGEYGDFRSYRIEDFDFQRNPKSTFTLRDGKEISFIDYFYKKYNIKIKDNS